MAVNQKQIAEKMGVSIALVSRVLSGKASEIGIAQDTIDRVMNAAAEMGYVPSAAALSLKGKDTRTIGVAVCDFNDPFFGSLIKEIQMQAHEHDYSLVLAGFLNRVPDQQDLQSLHKHAIDGLIVLGSEDEAPWLDDFSELPVARIGHGCDTERSVRISVDEISATAELIRHLCDQGASRIICLSGSLAAHRMRQDAFRKAAVSAGVEFDVITEQDSDPFTVGLKAMRRLIESKFSVDALVCTTDQIAMGALHALAKEGIDAPKQVAVTGFDDIPAAGQFIPPLTTIKQPIEEMVREAFRCFVETRKPSSIGFDGALVVRVSA